MTEKIKILCIKRNIPLAELAKKTGQTKQNLHSKLTRDNWRLDDLTQILNALNYTYNLTIVDTLTGEAVNI